MYPFCRGFSFCVLESKEFARKTTTFLLSLKSAPPPLARKGTFHTLREERQRHKGGNYCRCVSGWGDDVLELSPTIIKKTIYKLCLIHPCGGRLYVYCIHSSAYMYEYMSDAKPIQINSMRRYWISKCFSLYIEYPTLSLNRARLSPPSA